MKKHTSLFIAVLTCSAVSSFADVVVANQLMNLADVPVAERNPVALDLVWPEEVGQADICLWKDDKVAAISFTIDDNTKPDHDWWMEQQAKYGYRFTWFVITDRLMDERSPGFGGTWADFQRLEDAGHDVQSHTVRHRSKKQPADDILTLEQEYGDSQVHVNENIVGEACVVMAYPGGGYENDPEVAKLYYAGVRGTKGLRNDPSPDYLDTASIGSPQLSFTEPGEHGSWASLLGVVEKDDRAPKAYRNWYCMHFHGVNWHEETRGKLVPPLTEVFDYVKTHEDKFWVALFREVILYGQERDTATLTVTRNQPNDIAFNLTDRMRDDWYNFPLTIKVRVPDNWSSATATQDGASVSVTLLEHEGKQYALVDAVPDKGEVSLKSAS